MMAEAEVVNAVFEKYKPVFNDILKQLFTNQCSCEETELHFFYIKGLPKRFYFDGECLPAGSAQSGSEDSDSSHVFMKTYLNAKFGDRKYIMESKEIERPESRYGYVHWVLLSECLDSNYGKRLLTSAFRQLTFRLNQEIDLAAESDISGNLELGNYFHLVQQVLQNAALDTVSFLGRLFAPLQIAVISNLSGEYYEKSECQSNMVFLSDRALQSLKEQDYVFRLNSINWKIDNMEGLEFLPQNNRLIRKLLQIAREDLYLVMGRTENGESYKVLGICNEELLSKGSHFPYIKVEIKRHMQWSLFLNQTYIFTYKNGQYVIDRPLHSSYLKKKLTACFGQQEDGYESLIDNIINSTGQGHGTILVILEEKEAEKETKRLGDSKYGLPESFPQVHAKDINRLNAIDGSVFLDTNGKIHGIGMILDEGYPKPKEQGSSEEPEREGHKIPEGNLARGARFNSAKKYFEFLLAAGIKGMILIVSEDGSTDILVTNG